MIKRIVSISYLGGIKWVSIISLIITGVLFCVAVVSRYSNDLERYPKDYKEWSLWASTANGRFYNRIINRNLSIEDVHEIQRTLKDKNENPVYGWMWSFPTKEDIDWALKRKDSEWLTPVIKVQGRNSATIEIQDYLLRIALSSYYYEVKPKEPKPFSLIATSFLLDNQIVPFFLYLSGSLYISFVSLKLFHREAYELWRRISLLLSTLISIYVGWIYFFEPPHGYEPIPSTFAAIPSSFVLSIFVLMIGRIIFDWVRGGRAIDLRSAEKKE